MSYLKSGYILTKEFDTKEKLCALIKRIQDIISCMSINSDDIREHTRFHILENISVFLTIVHTEINFLEV